MRRLAWSLLFVFLTLAACSPGPKIQQTEAATASRSPSSTYAIETPVVPTPSAARALITEAPATRAPAEAPAPTQAPAPTAHAASLCGAPQNPWGYNFCGRGGYISNPPSDFCSYFNCIANFPNGTGYVEQCQDGMFSKSGGHSGSCSHHGGNKQPLYSGP